jgi:hypothetical protein
MDGFQELKCRTTFAPILVLVVMVELCIIKKYFLIMFEMFTGIKREGVS